VALKAFDNISLETRANIDNIFYCLMENGYTNFNMKNVEVTVLREIIHDNKTSILNYLIDHGLPIEKRNSEGNTLLFLAIFYRKLDIIKLLLDKGANIKHKNKKGESVHDYNRVKNFERSLEDYNEIESILNKYKSNENDEDGKFLFFFFLIFYYYSFIIMLKKKLFYYSLLYYNFFFFV